MTSLSPKADSSEHANVMCRCVFVPEFSWSSIVWIQDFTLTLFLFQVALNSFNGNQAVDHVSEWFYSLRILKIVYNILEID